MTLEFAGLTLLWINVLGLLGFAWLGWRAFTRSSDPIQKASNAAAMTAFFVLALVIGYLAIEAA